MASCINTNSSEFKSLASKVDMNKDTLLANVALWEVRNKELDRFPTKEEIEGFDRKMKKLANLERLAMAEKTHDQKVNARLEVMLEGLGINIQKDFDDLQGSPGFENTIKPNATSAFDVLQKYLSIKENVTNKDMALQTANAIYTFLGRKSKFSGDIWANIHKWEKYDEIYEKYANRNDIEEYLITPIENAKIRDNMAHRLAIVHFIADLLLHAIDNNGFKLDALQENVDIDKQYFESRGFKNDLYEPSFLKKQIKALWNWIIETFFKKRRFDVYTSTELKDLAMEIIDDVYKGDFYNFFRAYAQNSEGEIVDRKGVKYEQKFYQETLDKEPFAASIIKFLVDNPFINFKLSGSQTVRKFGTLFRPLEENLHDIDGVIPLSQFKKERNAVTFLTWIQTRGLMLTQEQKRDTFMKEVIPFIEKQTWYKNVKSKYPDFEITTVFIGKDHKKGESMTITGDMPIPGRFDEEGNPEKIVLDFFLRTKEGQYPEIFDNYWKDWKQIFEAKLNMGRAKDLADLLFFVPFKTDKYKFTNKGFRFYTFAENKANEVSLKDNPTPIKDIPSYIPEGEVYLDPYAQLKDTTLEEASQQAMLADGAQDITEIHSGFTLSSQAEKQLKEKGWSQEEIDEFNLYIAANRQRFRNESVAFIAAVRLQEYLEQNAENIKEVEKMATSADKMLDRYLMNWLKEYDVTIKPSTLQEIKERYGMDAIAITDVVNRVIAFSNEDINLQTLPEEYSHMLVELLGANSDIIKPLFNNVESWGKYNAIFNLYRTQKAYQNLDGSPNVSKIKKEAIGKLLSEAIVIQNSNRSVPKGKFLRIAYEALQSIIEFFNTGTPRNVTGIANKIARQVLFDNKKWANKYIENKTQREYTKDPNIESQESTKTLDTIRNIVNTLGAKLTNSLSTSNNGSIFKSGTTEASSLNFSMPESNFKPTNEKELTNWVNSTLKKAVPNFTAVEIIKIGETFRVSGIATDIESIVGTFSNHKGSVAERINKLNKFEKENSVGVTFSFESETKPNNIAYSTWEQAFDSQIENGTANLTKFGNIPIESGVETTSYEAFYASLDHKRIEEKARSIIAKQGIGKNKPLRRFGKVFYVKKDKGMMAYNENNARKFVRITNQTYFNGDPVLRIITDSYSKRRISIKPANYTGGQLNLFDSDNDTNLQQNCK